MIRGVLILLLTFVVLTLQQDTCTCQSSAPVTGTAGQTYPIDFGAQVQGTFTLTSQPDTTTAAGWASQFTSIPTLAQLQAYFANVLTTAQAQQNFDAAFADNSTAWERVANLTEMQALFDKQKAIMQAKWDAFWAKVAQLVDNKDDPKACAQLLIDIFNILSRERYIARLETWLSVHYQAATSFAQLTSQRVGVLAGQLQISQSIDAKMATCACDRTAATALALPAIPPDFTTAFTAFGTAIGTYTTTVQTAVTNNAAAFADTTEQDTIDDTDAKTIYNTWAAYENGKHPTYDTIVAWVKALIAAVDKKAAFVARIIACLKSDYKVTSPDWTCTGQDTDITTCNITGTISCTGDCTSGVDNMASYGKAVFLGWTGCVWAESKVVSYDSTSGAFDISITFSRVKIDLFLDALSDDSVKVAADIKTIVTAAKSEANTLNAGATEVQADVQTALDAQTAAANTAATAAAGASAEVINSVSARFDASGAYQTAQVSYQATLATKVKIWKVAFECWNASITKWREDKNCAVKALAKNLNQAATDLANAAADLYSSKIAALSDPNNDNGAKQYFADAKAALEQKVEDCCVTRDQIKASSDALAQVVSDIDTKKATIEAELTSNCNDLDAGVENSVAQIQAYWKGKESDVQDKVKTTISGVYSSVRDVICTFENLDGSAGSYVKATITIQDDGVAGETAQQCQDRQTAAIQAAITMTSKSTSFDVKFSSSASASAKRQSTTPDNTYTATSGNAPNPPPNPPPPGTGSAGTLVFSLVVAIVACFVLF